VQEHLQTFSEIKNEGLFFIGDYVATGYEGDETWLMDYIRVESDNGSVKISFTEEDEEQTLSGSDRKGKGKAPNRKGFFSTLFGQIVDEMKEDITTNRGR